MNVDLTLHAKALYARGHEVELESVDLSELLEQLEVRWILDALGLETVLDEIGAEAVANYFRTEE